MTTVPVAESEGSATDPDGEGDGKAPRSSRYRAAATMRCLPTALVFAVGVALFRSGGGFEPTTWYPAALFCLALAVVAAVSGLDLGLPSRPALIAVGTLLAYTGWAFLSISWADMPADAWQGANLTLLYALVFVIAALWRVPAGAGEWIVLAFALSVAVVGLLVIWAAARGGLDPNAGALLGGRLADPTSYPNATAAVFALACWPALGIVLEERMALFARATALGSVVALAELNLLCQSRGSIFTLPFVVVLFLLLTPRRVRAAIVMASVAVTVAAAAPTLLAVYGADSAAGRRDALGSALIAIVASATVLGAAGVVLPRLDRLPRLERRALLVLRAGLALAGVVAVVALLSTISPQARLHALWDDFRNGGVPSGSSHFTGLGSNRYDLWRVGLEEFRDHPIGGIGVDNFSVPYLERRRSDEQPLYPHSLAVRALSQTGSVGTLLLLVFFVAATLAVLRGSPRRSRAIAGGLLSGVAAWFLHGLADWLWELPALGLAAFALLGLAVGMAGWDQRRTPRPNRVPRSGRVLLTAASVGLVLAAAASLAFPWLAARYEQHALANWSRDTPGSLAALDRAAALNPLSDRPYVLAGAIEGRTGAVTAMRASFERAVSRNPFNWYGQLELAVAASAVGDRPAALVAARTAHRLNPREPMTLRVLRGIERGQPLQPAEVDRAFLRSGPG